MQHKRQGQKILWPPSISAHISHSWDSAHHIVWKLSTHAATKQSQATNFVTRCAHEISIFHYLYPIPVAASSATAAAGFGYDRDQVKTGESDIIMLLVISSGDGSWCNIAAPSSPCRALDLSARHRSISRFRLKTPTKCAHVRCWYMQIWGRNYRVSNSGSTFKRDFIISRIFPTYKLSNFSSHHIFIIFKNTLEPSSKPSSSSYFHNHLASNLPCPPNHGG